MCGVGNKAVLTARFEDARFFYRTDLARPLGEYVPKLAGTLFHAKLGTLLDKTERVEALIKPLAKATGLQGAHGLAFHTQPALVKTSANVQSARL